MPISLLIVGNFLTNSSNSRFVCEEIAERFTESGYSVLTASNKISRMKRLADMLNTVWSQRHNYDIALVDLYSGNAFFWAEAVCFILRIAKKPFVLVLRGGELPIFANRWGTRVSSLFRSATLIVAPSNYLFEKMGKYAANLQLIPNPIDLSNYEFKQRNKVNPKLIWLRAFHSIYNPSLAPEVVSLLVNDFPDIELIMIGPDKMDGSLQNTKQRAKELDVLERISFPGKVSKSEISSWLNQGDIFINTTNIDNTPVSVMEAMACGLCIVSTNVGGIPYLLKNEKDSLLVNSNDAEAMASSVRRIILDKELAKSLSFKARENVSGFDWKAVFPMWEKLILDMQRKG